ncbi:PREDICTED: U-box domain-containing protein 43-like [Ipomoea nil]|uniref:U-box domain-containing protein 43-like n=1 Tax=Ipomoea nil TaxID=35883 RepID=UPI000901CA63|nr:PREDICTED: U-box domain-containing protein 43-like [Ipomoea nil]XP_019197299.1 PREDICTED: U-box domain-containing protein 43-like [Ipomoea nil]
MVLDVITNSSFGPDLLSQTIESMLEVVCTSKNVIVGKSSLDELSLYLDRIVPILKELNKNNTSDSKSLENVVEILSKQTRMAKQLIAECNVKNKFYLLMNCRSIAKRIEGITKEMSRALSCIPLTSLHISSGIKEEIVRLIDNMRDVDFRAAVTEEEILQKIEAGIEERNVDRSYANNLLVSIAEAIGIPSEHSALKKEFEEFRNEIENARLRKNQAEALQMDQIIALLERADAASSWEDKEKKYFTKRNSLGSQPLEPLQSFYCPITGEVMIDPVETPSGHTFERSAIETWLTEENSCPITLNSLDTSMLRPNKTLRQSIEEWKERNTMITITSLKQKLLSDDDEEVLNCLEQLKDICEQREIHREWVLMEEYVSSLIKLLGAKSREIRNLVLQVLYILAKDNNYAKERIVEVDNGMEAIVRSLGRRIVEGKSSVALLLELSKNESIRDRIGKVQGCVLLLVTMSRGDDIQAAKDATDLLENLSSSDGNVIMMAKANYFKYLLQRLFAGPDDIKLIMATTLGEMELTDHNKSSLFEEGVLDSLLRLISHRETEMKVAAVKALLNLSSLPRNGLEMIRQGAVRQLLNMLYHHAHQSLGEVVAATIMNLAISTTNQGSSGTPVSLLDCDEDIEGLFSLIKLVEATVQESILRTFCAMCQSPSAGSVKAKIAQCPDVQLLVQLCEDGDTNVRAYAVKLLYHLVEDGNEAIIREHTKQKSIETLLRITTTSPDEEEIASALGIISNFPDSPQVSEWLLAAGGLPVFFKFLPDGNNSSSQAYRLVENAVGALCRLTDPTNLQTQRKAAEAGIVPKLVQLLGSGTSLTRKRAANALAQLSESSSVLSRPITKQQGFWCFSPSKVEVCPVHRGICGVESSFCLLEANAVVPLVRVLRDSDTGACEASLDALLTLIKDEMLQNGSKALDQADAIPSMIRLLSNPSPGLQEKVLHSLERVFRMVEYKQKYGRLAQMPLVDLTQRGSNNLKSLAAKVLAQLNVLHEQSSYF